jgi:hypothetical protein
MGFVVEREWLMSGGSKYEMIDQRTNKKVHYTIPKSIGVFGDDGIEESHDIEEILYLYFVCYTLVIHLEIRANFK